MVETDLQTLTSEQHTQLQRQYLSARFCGSDPLITDKSLESDGRKRNRIVKEAVNAGFLVPTNEKSAYGISFRINADVISSVVPSTLALFELWAALQEKNPHREAYERPWIRVEGQSVENQCAFLNMDDIDWFVVSRMPYEYQGSFADVPETIVTDGRPSDSFIRYWAGPFPTLDAAIERRKAISGSSLAASSNVLRQQVAEFFAERKVQRAFANNLLWGLVDIALVPNDLLFDADGKPTLDTQLEEGHSLRFDSNPNPPAGGEAVNWESNLAKSIERLKSRIARAEQQLDKLRVIETRVQSCGGWASFMNTMEKRLRAELLAEKT